jgi:polysaccharide export outer membrane protein
MSAVNKRLSQDSTMKRLLIFAAVAWLTASAAALVGAQTAPPQAGLAPTTSTTSAQPTAPNGVAAVRYTLGPRDRVKITVFDEPELTNSYTVDADGFISFPLIGPLTAGGLTVGQLQDRLRSMLAAGYLRNPEVRVEMEQFQSRSVIVSGEVRSPGKIAMTGPMTLLEALALAGSPTASASNEVLVSHPKKPGATTRPGDPNAQIIRVNLKDLQLGKAGQDIVLQDGDIINVPKAQTFFIMGQVRNAGSFVWESSLTVEQAIALAGGLNDRGSTRGIVARRSVDGRVREVSVRLEDKVEANDTIVIRSRFF